MWCLLEKGKEDRAAKKCEKYALKEIPGIIEYLGYTFCFANCLAGPAYEFSVYRNACDGTLLYTKDGKPRGKIPSSFMPALLSFLLSIVNMVVFVVLGGMFPILDPADPQKNTPIVGQFKFARFAAFPGTAKSAFAVTEQFAFYKAVR